MKILRVDSLTLRFGALAAVNDLSFELEEGEILGIAGPNGAGKTSLFNAITGFYKYAGDIFFYDDKISGLRPHPDLSERHRPHVPDSPAFFDAFGI